jgi:protein-tyrosine phosphatase
MPSQSLEPSADAYRFAPAAPDERCVFGACAPGWHTAATSDEALDDWLAFMQSRDIEAVCCLLPGETLERGETNTARYVETFGREHVCHAPIPDRRLASERLLSETALPFLDGAVAADRRVVVHGLAGLDRTGQVLAAWLVYGRSYEPTAALETVFEMGRTPLGTPQGEAAAEQREADLLDLLATVE